jgi:hypothetical protein
MNRNDFTGIIHNASLIDRQMIGEVRELVDLFPYFQSAHLLLLKGLHNVSDVKFENQLRQSAIHVADREVLYYLLRKEPVEVSEQPDPVNIVSVDEPVASGDQQTYVESGASDLLELDLQEEVSEESGESIISLEETPDEERNSRKQIQAELIDKFIIANPRIEPVRDKTDHPAEDISRPFTEEKGGFITETLAKIYITQGYYSKAIDIYEKLSLKFPEKSSYFATQIEKVRELIK